MQALTGLIRLIRRRWWVIVALALVGAAAGYAISERANRSIEPLFEASTYVQFEAENQRDRDSTIEKVQAAADAAMLYNAEALEQRLGRITINEQDIQLVFTSRSPDRATAAANAELLRSNYVDGTAAAVAQARQERLNEIIIEAAAVLDQIEALTPEDPPTEEDPEISQTLQLQIDSLNDLHDALELELTQTNVNLVLAQSGDTRVGDPEDLQEKIDSIQYEMASIRSKLVVIALENDLDPEDITPQTNQPGNPTPALPSPTQDPRDSTPDPETVDNGGLTDQLTLDALEDRYGELTSEFGDLFLEAENETEPVLAPVEVTDMTPAPVSAELNAIIGFVIGAFLAIGALFVTKTVRGRMFGPADVAPLPVLAELPTAATLAAKPSAQATALRHGGIKQLRQITMRYMDASDQSLVLGYSGVSTSDGEVSLLAVEVGNRLAASDRTVLVMDLNFGTTVQYEGDSGITVAKLLHVMREDTETGATYFRETLLEGNDGRRLRVIAPGRLQGDPTDAVLTQGFVNLVTAARDNFDIVLAVLPPAPDSLTEALRRRIDGVIAVCVERVSRRSELEYLTMDTDAGGAPALGVAFLTGVAPGRSLWSKIRAALRPPAPRGRRIEETATPKQRKKREKKQKKEKTKKAAAPTPVEPVAGDPAPPAAPTPTPRPAPPPPAPEKTPVATASVAPKRRRPKEKAPAVSVDVDRPPPPRTPAPTSLTRAAVEWIKAWPYNDMEPLPHLPRDRRPDRSQPGR